jgi:hypothetical protein
MLAGRLQLQERQTYENQSIFVDAALQFNDWNFKTGGLIVAHDEFLVQVLIARMGTKQTKTTALNLFSESSESSKYFACILFIY